MYHPVVGALRFVLFELLRDNFYTTMPHRRRPFVEGELLVTTCKFSFPREDALATPREALCSSRSDRSGRGSGTDRRLQDRLSPRPRSIHAAAPSPRPATKSVQGAGSGTLDTGEPTKISPRPGFTP